MSDMPLPQNPYTKRQTVWHFTQLTIGWTNSANCNNNNYNYNNYNYNDNITALLQCLACLWRHQPHQVFQFILPDTYFIPLSCLGLISNMDILNYLRAAHSWRFHKRYYALHLATSLVQTRTLDTTTESEKPQSPIICSKNSLILFRINLWQ